MKRRRLTKRRLLRRDCCNVYRRRRLPMVRERSRLKFPIA